MAKAFNLLLSKEEKIGDDESILILSFKSVSVVSDMISLNFFPFNKINLQFSKEMKVIRNEKITEQLREFGNNITINFLTESMYA